MKFLFVILLLASHLELEAAGKTITRHAAKSLLAEQWSLARAALSRGLLVIALGSDIEAAKSYKLHVISNDRESITNFFKAMLEREKDSSGYLLQSADDGLVEKQYYYFYANLGDTPTRYGYEWLDITTDGYLKNKMYIPTRLSVDELVWNTPSLRFLKRLLHNSRFYVARYLDEKNSSVFYLSKINDKILARLQIAKTEDEITALQKLLERIKQHNRGEIIISKSDLRQMESLVGEGDLDYQSLLRTLKVEIPAEILISGLHRGIFAAEHFHRTAIDKARRVRRHKQAAMDAEVEQNHDLFADLHIPQPQLPNQSREIAYRLFPLLHELFQIMRTSEDSRFQETLAKHSLADASERSNRHGYITHRDLIHVQTALTEAIASKATDHNTSRKLYDKFWQILELNLSRRAMPLKELWLDFAMTASTTTRFRQYRHDANEILKKLGLTQTRNRSLENQAFTHTLYRRVMTASDTLQREGAPAEILNSIMRGMYGYLLAQHRDTTRDAFPRVLREMQDTLEFDNSL